MECLRILLKQQSRKGKTGATGGEENKKLEAARKAFDTLDKLGGPGGIRTHDVLSEADYESAACNQHGVRPEKKKTRS